MADFFKEIPLSYTIIGFTSIKVTLHKGYASLQYHYKKNDFRRQLKVWHKVLKSMAHTKGDI